jgi:NAD(P)-dependent dehydrogenase (short-subunit alcohol dehydrogenase family)
VGAARTITPELKETGAYAVPADLSTAEGVSALIEGALAELGGIDLLVNNVGGGDEAVLGFLDADDTQWTRMFDINVLATVRATRAALTSLIERRGAIVNVSSTLARMPGNAPGRLQLGQGGGHRARQVPGRGIRPPGRPRTYEGAAAAVAPHRREIRRAHITPLAYLADGENWAVFAANSGGDASGLVLQPVREPGRRRGTRVGHL